MIHNNHNFYILVIDSYTSGDPFNFDVLNYYGEEIREHGVVSFVKNTSEVQNNLNHVFRLIGGDFCFTQVL